jgi:hypothetical protein
MINDITQEIIDCINMSGGENRKDAIQWAIDAVKDGQNIGEQARNLVTNEFGYDLFHDMGETLKKCEEVRKILRKVLDESSK